jgi:hypothetical protein
MLSFIEIGVPAAELQLRQPPYRVKKWSKNRFFCNNSLTSATFKAKLVHSYRSMKHLFLEKYSLKSKCPQRLGRGSNEKFESFSKNSRKSASISGGLKIIL